MPEILNSPASLFIFSWESARPDDLGFCSCSKSARIKCLLCAAVLKHIGLDLWRQHYKQ